MCVSPSQAGLRAGNALPEKVKIVEVGPRDGLQNEKAGQVFLFTCLICLNRLVTNQEMQ